MAVQCKQILSCLGLLGVMVCGVGICGVWYVEWRADRVRQRMFESVDLLFGRIDDGVSSAQRVVQDSRITLAEVQQHLRESMQKKGGQNLSAKLQLASRAEKLSGGLRRAEGMINASLSAVESIRDLLRLGEAASLPVNTEWLDGLYEQVSALKSQVAVAEETADRLCERVRTGDEADASRAEQVRKLVVTLVAAFSQVDRRLTEFAARATEARDAVGHFSTKARNRIVGAAILATLFFLWMATGQVFLWRRA